MELLLALLVLCALLGTALGLCWPTARRGALVLLAVAGAAAALAGLLGPAERTLEATHTFAAYAPDGFEVVPRHFVVDQATAPGWQWAMPWLAFAGCWGSVLLVLQQGRRMPHPLLLPLLLAWTGTATWLAMQWLAAPAAVVQPFGLDRFLFPACLCLTVLLAQRGQRFAPILFTLCLAVVAARLPAALFSKLASDRAWGTGLDIHSITVFVNPVAGQEVEVAAGSVEQQAWLIWAQHLFFVPAFYLLSLSGIAFGLFMYRKHGQHRQPAAD